VRGGYEETKGKTGVIHVARGTHRAEASEFTKRGLAEGAYVPEDRDGKFEKKAQRAERLWA